MGYQCLSIIQKHYSYLWNLHVLDPLDGLSLRINHKRPTTASGDNHTVLCGETITGQTLDIPVSHTRRFGHEVTEAEIWGAWNSKLSNL